MAVWIIRGISIAALFLAFAWVRNEPSWESGITALALLGGVFSTFLANPSRRSAKEPPPTAQTGNESLPESQAVSQSIVVLPFDNLSPDPADSYFSDGLTEEIITKLSRLKSLRVISRSSAMALKGTQKDVRTIGRELDVQHVLEGSVRKAGNDLRITAQLIETQRDSHVWAENYDGVLDDVFLIQETVAKAIVDALNLTLGPEEEGKISQRTIDNVHAYDCLLRARQEIWRWTPDALARATKHLENGIRIIGENADLLFGLGNVQFQYVNAGYKVGDEAEEALSQAEAYARDIFRIHPDSAQGHCLMGLVAWQNGKSREVVRHLRAALSKDPGNPDALWFLGLALAQAGRVEAARPLIQQLVKRDPLAPLSHATEGYMYQMEGNFGSSMPHYERAFDMDPDDPFLRVLLAYAHVLEGNGAEAEPLFESVSSTNPTHVVQWIGSLYGAALRHDGSQVRRLESSEFSIAARRASAYSLWVAEAYALLKEPDKAMSWLENAIERGQTNYPFLSKWNPIFEGLREEPRFVDLMAKVKKQWQEFDA